MSEFKNKVDFVAFISVNHANPNGDPLNGNRPRDTIDGFGEISDVCIKRKIRNRLQDMGEPIFVQSDDRCDDGCKSLKSRAENCEELKKHSNDKDVFARIACEKWTDVRAFGQVFAFKGKKKDDEGVSVGVRGPVTIQPAFSLEPVEIESTQITKSVNSEDKAGKSSDTMGMKHRVKFGIYMFKGSINCQLAEKTGFTEEDAENIKQAIATLFENDCSSARPDGTMCMEKLFWFKHSCKSGQYSSAKVHKSISIEALCDEPKSIDDYKIEYDGSLEGLSPEVIK